MSNTTQLGASRILGLSIVLACTGAAACSNSTQAMLDTTDADVPAVAVDLVGHEVIVHVPEGEKLFERTCGEPQMPFDAPFERRVGNQWEPLEQDVPHTLGQPDAYYLDGVFIDAVDVGCESGTKAPPQSADLSNVANLVAADPPLVPWIETQTFHGKLRVQLKVFHDAACSVATPVLTELDVQ